MGWEGVFITYCIYVGYCLMIFNVFWDVIILRPHLWPGDHGCIPYVSTFSYLCKNLDL